MVAEARKPRTVLLPSLEGGGNLRAEGGGYFESNTTQVPPFPSPSPSCALLLSRARALLNSLLPFDLLADPAKCEWVELKLDVGSAVTDGDADSGGVPPRAM